MVLNEDRLLEIYFQPLIKYKKGDVYKDNEISEPLWHYRNINIQEHRIIENIQKFLEASDTNNIKHVLAQYIINSTEKNFQFSQLSSSYQDELLYYACSISFPLEVKLKIYFTSLLITFLIRDKDPDNVDVALEFLKCGQFKGTLKDKQVQLSLLTNDQESKTSFRLIKNIYIELKGANLCGKTLDDTLDLSGQNLCYLNGKNCQFEGLKINWSCVEESVFNQAKFSRVQAKGASFCKTNFSKIISNESSFEEANFNDADFSNAYFISCYFDGANFYDVIYKNTRFSECHLFNVKQFNFDKPIIDSCYFSDEIEEFRKAFDEFKKSFEEIVNNESIVSPDGSPSWPIDGKKDPNWCIANCDIVELDKNSELFKVINFYIHLTSDKLSYKAPILEVPRLSKALKDGEIFKFIANEITTGGPAFKGSPAGITIEKILVIKNRPLWGQYQKEKQKIFDFLKQNNIEKPLSDLRWHSGNETELPVLNSEVGECWLFHGTREAVAKSIIENGFTTAYMQKGPILGWNTLGKGIYFSDSFPKVSTYLPQCDKCFANECNCLKVVLLSRVILGNTFRDTQSSFLSNRRYENEPPEGYNSRSAPDKQLNSNGYIKDLLEFKFYLDFNEFCVPHTQAYPEFLIFYKQNKKSFENSELNGYTGEMPKPELWKKQYKHLLTNLINFSELNEELNNYFLQFLYGSNEHRILSLKNIVIEIDKNLKDKCNDERVNGLLNDIRKRCINEYNLITNNLNPVNICIELEISYYFRTRKWRQVISKVNELFEPQKTCFFYLMNAISYKQLNQPSVFISNVMNALEINDECLKNGLYDLNETEFYETSINLFFDTCEYHSNQNYFENWFIKIAEWLAYCIKNGKLCLDTWEYFFWSIIDNKQKHILKSKLSDSNDDLVNEFISNLADQQGDRSKISLEKRAWNESLKRLITTEETDVEVSWLEEDVNGEYKLFKGFLNEDSIKCLFQPRTGYPNKRKAYQGNCLVFDLKYMGSDIIAYMKFYPFYPLRQQAVDELLYKLSGYGVYTTIAKLKHKKRPNKPYPVIFSSPIVENFDWYYVQNLDGKIENNLNDAAFTWKFFETYLLQPRDDKSDNFGVIKTRNGDYVYISFDNDMTLGQKKFHVKQPNVYSMIYLSNHMSKNCNINVIRQFCSLNIEELLTDWLEKVNKKFKLLIGNDEEKNLFTEAEAKYIKNLMDYRYEYNIHCNLDKLFSNSDLIALYDRMQVLLHTLNSFSMPKWKLVKKGEYYEMDASSCETMSHWSLLEKLDKDDFEDYIKAFNFGENIVERFQKLPGFEENFKKENFFINNIAVNAKGYRNMNRGNFVTKSNYPQPAGILWTLLFGSNLIEETSESCFELNAQKVKLAEYREKYKEFINKKHSPQEASVSAQALINLENLKYNKNDVTFLHVEKNLRERQPSDQLLRQYKWREKRQMQDKQQREQQLLEKQKRDEYRHQQQLIEETKRREQEQHERKLIEQQETLKKQQKELELREQQKIKELQKREQQIWTNQLRLEQQQLKQQLEFQQREQQLKAEKQKFELQKRELLRNQLLDQQHDQSIINQKGKENQLAIKDITLNAGNKSNKLSIMVQPSGSIT